MVFSDRNDDGVVGVTDIEQINNYYPFGMNMDGPWNGANGAFKYQYNGKELSSEFGLNWNDYGARFYDPAIGRWNSVDLMAKSYSSYTPFGYVRNMPINLIDPNGMYDLPAVTITAKRTEKQKSTLNFGGLLEGINRWVDRTPKIILNEVAKNLSLNFPYTPQQDVDEPENETESNNDKLSEDFADILSIIIGVVEIGGDGVAAVPAEVGTAGIATPVLAAVAIHGTGVISTSIL